jgi:hypothetical protein
MALGDSFQRQNHNLLQSEDKEAHLARLNGAPRQVQKVALLFAATLWAKPCAKVWDGILHPPPLQLAIDPVNQCLQTALQRDTPAEKALVASSADALLARIRRDFASPEYLCDGWITLTKTQLTAKYASQPDRPHSWKPDDLYRRFLPELTRRGLARWGGHLGKKVSYCFTVEV